MKSIDKENISNVKDDSEKRTKVNIDIQEYDSKVAYLDILEDLDDKTISYIEREIRNSIEYRNYINYLKNELDLTKCSLMPGIDIKETAVSLEFHHYPLTLFDITKIVGSEMIDKLDDNEKVSCFDISERVLEEHYLNNVGLVPLTKTMHDMAHNRTIVVPIDKVNGNYKSFLQKYSNYIDEEIQDKVTEIEMESMSDESKQYNKTKLEKNIMEYNINYYRNQNEEE